MTTNPTPTRYRQPARFTRQVHIYLTADQLAWLQQQPAGPSETVRALIDNQQENEYLTWLKGYLELHPGASDAELKLEYSIFQAS